MSVGPIEATERAAEDAAVRFLLDGLGVGSLRELHALVEAGRAAIVEGAPRGGDAADPGPRGHSNEATSLPAQTAPQPVSRRVAEQAWFEHTAAEHAYSSDADCEECDRLWSAVVAAWRA